MTDFYIQCKKMSILNAKQETKIYTITGVRHMTMENGCMKDLNDNQRKILSESVFVNALETQDNVYVNINRLTQETQLREWLDSGCQTSISSEKHISNLLRNDVEDNNDGNLVGRKISKYFENHGKFFTGTIKKKEYTKEKKTKKIELTYCIKYDDKEKEDLTKEEIDSYVKEGVLKFIE